MMSQVAAVDTKVEEDASAVAAEASTVTEAKETSRSMYVSKIDMVTGALRSQIQNGEYRPGQPLRQRDVAAALGVSITPVREALRPLERRSDERRVGQEGVSTVSTGGSPAH